MNMQNNYDDDFAHYGVLGMKWGVRRNPNKAFDKATRKAKRLDAKTADAKAMVDAYSSVHDVFKNRKESIEKKRAANRIIKPSRRQLRSVSRDKARAHRTLKKARKTLLRAQAKSEKWQSKMSYEFRKTKLSDVDPAVRNYGLNYVGILYGSKKRMGSR